MSQAKFAKKADIGMRTLVKIENDEEPVKLNTLRLIATNCKLKQSEFLDLVRAWLHTQLGDLSDKFFIDPKSPIEIKDQESSVISKLVAEISKLPPRFQSELLKAVGRQEVLQGIKTLNEMYDRLRGQ
jgi:transcriptional regulator with XRE-family HTH domain